MNTAYLEELDAAVIRKQLAEHEAEVAVLRCEQARMVAELDRRQAATAAGHRSLHDLLAATLDVDHDTARKLVDLSRVDGETWRDAADGEVTVDRALAEGRLVASGVADRVRRDSRRHSIRGVRRLAKLRERFTPVDNDQAHDLRYLVIQPNLDESVWDLHGRLTGIDGQLVADAVAARGDELHAGSDLPSTPRQRAADGLVSLVLDGADGAGADDPADGDVAGGPLGLVATVFVDAELAAATRGMAGAEVVGGTRVGPRTLEEILCSGWVEINVAGARLMTLGPTGQGIPPRLRRHVIARDGGRCTVGGCRSRYRLQVHHIRPVSEGGGNDLDNLGTFCWFHHHVAIHGSGFRVDPDSPPQRRRLLRPSRGPPDG